MDRESRLRIELLHSIGWMFLHSNTTHLWRKKIDSGTLLLPSEVERNCSFATPSGDDHLIIGNVFEPLNILSIDDDTCDHSAFLRFTFLEETLRIHLEHSDRLNLVDRDHLITTFLSTASEFGSRFESSVTGKQAIESLPVPQATFVVPSHFEGPIDALCDVSLCSKKKGGYRWGAAIRPHMQSARLWIGDQTKKEIRENELIKMWRTMPLQLKSIVTDSGNIEIGSLAVAIAHLWYDGQWHRKPENSKQLDLDSDPRMDLATAKEICRLHRKGKLEL